MDYSNNIHLKYKTGAVSIKQGLQFTYRERLLCYKGDSVGKQKGTKHFNELYPTEIYSRKICSQKQLYYSFNLTIWLLNSYQRERTFCDTFVKLNLCN